MNGMKTNGATSDNTQKNGHPLTAAYNNLTPQQLLQQIQQQSNQPMQRPPQQTPDASQQPQQSNSLPTMGVPGLFNGLQMNPMAMAAFNPLQMAQMTGGLPQIPGLPFPQLIPPQILQEVFTLSKPVDSSDEPLLIETLRQGLGKGETYKEVLNGLHGKNNHSSILWKDYFLEHMDRLLAAVEGIQKPVPTAASRAAVPTVKKPMHTNFKRESTTPSISSSSQRHQPTKRKRESQEPRSSLPPKDRPDAKKRTTLNSFTTHTAVFSRNLPAPHADLKTPEPPSREPTPPPMDLVPIVGPRGNKYTQEEREYFLKFIGWSMKQDPSLTRKVLCDRLAEKLPHHTSASWSSYWSNNHDLPDKIYASLRDGGESDSDSEDHSEPELKITASPKRRRPNYKDSSSDDDEYEGPSTKYQAYTTESSEDDDDSVRSYSESEMGQQGTPYTDADLYITAKHIVSRPNFDTEPGTLRWGEFAKQHTQRSFKSWVEYFRRNEKALMSMARKIRRKQKRNSRPRSSIQNQRARPSWAKEGNHPPHIKRKFGAGAAIHSTSDSDSDQED